jgi:hypothetical protein
MSAEKFLFLRPESEISEWKRAWRMLETITGDELATESQIGEVWQYMGSARQEGSGTRPGKIVHEFRHRWHPVTERRELVLVPASWVYSDAQNYAEATR